jgi:hypothetical protein
LPLDTGHVNNNVDIALALKVADVRLLDGHGSLEEVLAPGHKIIRVGSIQISEYKFCFS